MEYFALKRIDDPNSNFIGVETPSQKRYVKYFEIILNKLNGKMPDEKSLKLKRIIIHSLNRKKN